MDKQSKSLSIRSITLFGILGALLFGGKVALMSLPNIEIVSLCVMLFAVTFGYRCVYPITVYVLLELTVFGFHYWSLNYLYIWFIPALAAFLLRRMESPLGWAVLSGTFGLLFGALCAPVHLFVGGPAYALTWWLNGIPYDLIHATGNFFIAWFLFTPMRKWLQTLVQRYSF